MKGYSEPDLIKLKGKSPKNQMGFQVTQLYNRTRSYTAERSTANPVTSNIKCPASKQK